MTVLRSLIFAQVWDESETLRQTSTQEKIRDSAHLPEATKRTKTANAMAISSLSQVKCNYADATKYILQTVLSFLNYAQQRGNHEVL